MHILIIEDDALLALNLQMLVEDLGASSSLIVASEQDAEAQAKRFPPDIIIADLHLKQGNGVSAVQRIRSGIGAVPVVYVTANPDEAARLDPDALVLSKPLREEELVTAIGRLKPLVGEGS
jgi:CheY-like chemotaxis protein